ncbi:MAG: hypothetical protein QXY62_05875 [Candidatus Altiarchaeota archaeon]
MKQVATESIRKYIKVWVQEKGYCPFSILLNEENYCHFLNPKYCPFDFMEKIETEIFSIPQRKFHRCLGVFE